MTYYVYVLQSQKDQTFYKGMTVNLESRLIEHNTGQSKYTSSRIPWKIIYHEIFETELEAVKREKYFKSAAGRRFLKKILGS